MIKMFNYKVFIIILLSIGLPTICLSQVFSDSQKILKTYKVSSSTTVDVTNKYGKIHIIQWENDSVSFNIEVLARSNDMDKVTAAINNIDFDFTVTSHYIAAKTVFIGERSSLISDLKKLANTFISSQSQVKIDYIIMVPSYVDIRLSNKYGDVYVDDIKGDFQLDLSNGDFKANSLEGSTSLELKFCNNADINTIANGRLNILYSDFHVKNSQKLTITSKSSKINIDKADVLKISSRSDKYNLSDINYIYGETYFSDIRLYKLSQEANLDLRYGDVNFEFVSKQFSFINLDSKYTDIRLFFEQGSSYHLDITHKANELHLPEVVADLKEQNTGEDRREYITYGTIGDKSSTSKLRIKGEDSSINIFHK